MARYAQAQQAPAADPTEAAADAFDRLGARAMSLARWVAADEASSVDAVVAVFAQRAIDRGDWDDDAALLREVRRRALVRSSARPPARASVLAAGLATMPPVQREVVELAVIGRLHPSSIARAIGAAPAEVAELLLTGMRALVASGSRGSERLQV